MERGRTQVERGRTWANASGKTEEVEREWGGGSGKSDPVGHGNGSFPTDDYFKTVVFGKFCAYDLQKNNRI